jgi:hypothetical protein
MRTLVAVYDIFLWVDMIVILCFTFVMFMFIADQLTEVTVVEDLSIFFASLRFILIDKTSVL